MPPALERVILKALAKAPDDRFATANAMVQALRQATDSTTAASQEPVTSPPQTEVLPTLLETRVVQAETKLPFKPVTPATTRRIPLKMAMVPIGIILIALLLWWALAQLNGANEPTETITLVTETAVSATTTDQETVTDTAIAMASTSTFTAEPTTPPTPLLTPTMTEVEITASAAQATEAQATKIAEEATQTAPPVVQISSPADGAIFSTGENIHITLTADDVRGLFAVNLTINDKTIESYSLNNETQFSTNTTWSATVSGDYVISVMAINGNGRASDPVTLTITIAEADTDSLAALRDQVEANVIEIRGLDPLSPIEPTLLSSDELRQRTVEDFAEETTPEETREDTIVLSAFDFMSRDYDLYQALIDLQSEAVLGFYDPETAEFVVVSDDNELDAEEQWTHAHEFMHALQDQYYPLELISDDSLDSEASFALRALAEGEASLVQYLYLIDGYFSEEQQTEIFASFDEEGPAIYDELPPVIFNSFIFPYNEGFEFVLQLYSGGDLFAPGDFAVLEAAWNNLPQSSEQIIHPERYVAGDAPLVVSLPRRARSTRRRRPPCPIVHRSR
jgi:hypothetical protein